METKQKITQEPEKQRTANQNSALHLWFTQLSEALNDAGFDVKKTVREGIDIPWTPYLVKELLWRKVQEAFLQKKSTTELNKTEDINKIYDILNKAIGERTGVHIPFPSIDTAMDAEREKEFKN